MTGGIYPSDGRHGDQNKTSVSGPPPIYGSGEVASDEPGVAPQGGQLSESGDANISPRADVEPSGRVSPPIYGSGVVASDELGVLHGGQLSERVSDANISPRADAVMKLVSVSESVSDSRHGDQIQTLVSGPPPIYGSGDVASDELGAALHGRQLWISSWARTQTLSPPQAPDQSTLLAFFWNSMSAEQLRASWAFPTMRLAFWTSMTVAQRAEMTSGVFGDRG